MGAIPWFDIGAKVVETGVNQLTGAQEYNRTKKLMEIQQQNQMELNEQGRNLQMLTWEQTNFPAQMAMLKKAGLNPGLMYAKGGQGGTTGGQGGGSASMGSAPRSIPMDIMNSLALSKMKADIENVKADTGKKQAEAGVIGATGIEEAQSRIGKLLAETKSAEAQKALTEAETAYRNLQSELSSKSMDELIKGIELNNQKLATEVRKGVQEATISEATAGEVIKQIQLRTIEQGLEIALQKENIIKTGAQTDEIKTHIRTMATEVAQRWTQLSQSEQQIMIQQELMKFGTNLPSRIGQWTGIVGNILSGAKGIVVPSQSVTMVR